MRAMLDAGAERVLGIDRWPGFARGATPDAPVVLHDLTLPMPFLSTASFDAVFSHFVLEYLSPIAIRQVLQEANRVLEADGRLLLYLVATGAGGGDETKSSPYGPRAMGLLLDEAGFAGELDLSPNGRNLVVRARRRDGPAPTGAEARTAVHGEAQLSAAFAAGAEEGPVAVELVGPGRGARLTLTMPPGRAEAGRVAVCARVVALPGHGVELQAWAWSGTTIVCAESLRAEFSPQTLQIEAAGALEHAAAWSPELLSVEPAGDAYAAAAALPPGDALDDLARVAEGRRLVVEPKGHGDVGADDDRVGPGRNRLRVRRVAGRSLTALEADWRVGRLDGLVVDTAELAAADPGLALWAADRGVPLLLEGPGWAEILAGAHTPAGERGIILIDPVLTVGGPATPPPAEVVEQVAVAEAYVVLAPATAAMLDPSSRDALRNHLLVGGGQSHDAVAVENLRYLCERALLMRLRHVHRTALSDLGRRPGLG